MLVRVSLHYKCHRELMEIVGVVSTVLGEITDRSNQASAFTWLPVVYGLGAITGPIIGGLLVNSHPDPDSPWKLFVKYPYLPPNLISCMLLLVDLVMSLFMLDESLEEAQQLSPLSTRMRCLFSWLWNFLASYGPSYIQFGSGNGRNCDEPRESLVEACPAMLPQQLEQVSYHEMLAPQISEFPSIPLPLVDHTI